MNLEDVVGRRLDRSELARALLDRVEFWYRNIGTEELQRQWRAGLNMLNRHVVAGEIHGTAIDVKADGTLLVRDGQGNNLEVRTPDIRIHLEGEVA